MESTDLGLVLGLWSNLQVFVSVMPDSEGHNSKAFCFNHI